WGWIALASVIIGAIKGIIVGAAAGGVGAIPGAWVGAAEGWATAMEIGAVLAVSFVAQTVVKVFMSIDELAKGTRDGADLTPEQEEVDYKNIAQGIVFAVVSGIMYLLGPKALEFGKKVLEALDGLLTNFPGYTALKNLIKKGIYRCKFCFLAGTQVQTEAGLKNIED